MEPTRQTRSRFGVHRLRLALWHGLSAHGHLNGGVSTVRTSSPNRGRKPLRVGRGFRRELARKVTQRGPSRDIVFRAGHTTPLDGPPLSPIAARIRQEPRRRGREASASRPPAFPALPCGLFLECSVAWSAYRSWSSPSAKRRSSSAAQPSVSTAPLAAVVALLSRAPFAVSRTCSASR